MMILFSAREQAAIRWLGWFLSLSGLAVVAALFWIAGVLA